MKKPEISEDEKTKNLAGHAFYKSKKTPKSQMIMLKMLQANRLDPLHKANKMAALAFFIKPDSEELQIDYELVDVIHTVSNALLKTSKQKIWVDQWTSCIIYPIPWSFQFTLETYRKYIRPWMETYNYYKINVPKIQQYKITETFVFCPYCSKPIHGMPQTTKDKALKNVEEIFSESIKSVLEVSIDKNEFERRKALALPGEYNPPHWKASYLDCPKCKQKIRLTFEFFKGTDNKQYEPVEKPEFETKEIIFEDKEIVAPIVQVIRYKHASSYLSETGYSQQITSFLQWAEPIVSHIEWEILKLVDENVLEKYLDQIFQSNEEKTLGEEQN